MPGQRTDINIGHAASENGGDEFFVGESGRAALPQHLAGRLNSRRISVVHSLLWSVRPFAARQLRLSLHGGAPVFRA